MKCLFFALGALCLLALSVSGIVLVVRVQQRQAATRRFIEAGPANLEGEQERKGAHG